MAQQNESDLSMKFSTLNVNAMEFVPSFVQDRGATAPTEDTQSPPQPVSAEDSPAPAEKQASPAKTPTNDVIEDKSPENPGKKMITKNSNQKNFFYLLYCCRVVISLTIFTIRKIISILE